MPLPTKEEAALGRMLRVDVNKEFDALAVVIRTRFGFEEEAKAVAAPTSPAVTSK